MARLATLILSVTSVMISGSQQCGQPKIAPSMTSYHSIVGGNEARPHSWPWMASIHWTSSVDDEDYGHNCGASLINSRWVLTAAHCIDLDFWDIPQYNVFLGSHNFERPAQAGTSYKVESIHVHEDYVKEDMYSDDIALIKLKTPVTMGDHVQPVCLPEAGHKWPAGTTFTVTGWGHTREGGMDSDVLNQVELPLLSHAECHKMYGSRLVHEGVLCAGYRQGGKDSCQNDSGGPLVTKVGNTWVQAGIVSWGFGCARSDTYAVYTNVATYRGWIDNTIANN